MKRAILFGVVKTIILAVVRARAAGRFMYPVQVVNSFSRSLSTLKIAIQRNLLNTVTKE